MRFKKILCPIDFSPTSEQAMRTAVALANAHDAALVLVHVWRFPASATASDFGFSPEVVDQLAGDAQRSLEAAAKEAARLGARRLASKLVMGTPLQQLIDILESDPAFDLVVMGTHGRTGGARVLLGSVAEAVVRHAPCPVLTVPCNGEQSSFSNVVCPVDFSDSSKDALDLAAGLVHPGGVVTLMHVVEMPGVYGIEITAGGGGIERDLTASAARQLAQWRADLVSRTPVQVQVALRTGRPGEQLLAALDTGAFDLVVMGNRGRTGLARLLLGSVAEKVVRHASCPVLVTHRRH